MLDDARATTNAAASGSIRSSQDLISIFIMLILHIIKKFHFIWKFLLLIFGGAILRPFDKPLPLFSMVMLSCKS